MLVEVRKSSENLVRKYFDGIIRNGFCFPEEKGEISGKEICDDVEI